MVRETSSFRHMFLCSIIPEELTKILPYCSFSQCRQVCRNRILHGVLTRRFHFQYHLELEGKRKLPSGFQDERKHGRKMSSRDSRFFIQGQFYNIGQHQDPPFSAPAFSLPPENDNMLYTAMSAFTVNSAAFVYHRAGVLSMYITDDMVSLIPQSPVPSPQSDLQDITLTFPGSHQQIPKSSPIRLTTTTFGTFIPQVNNNAPHSVRAATFNVNPPTKPLCFQISKQFPGLMMKLLVKTDKSPVVTFEPNKVTVQATGTVTAYAIQPNNTLTPLFILNLVGFATGIQCLGS